MKTLDTNSLLSKFSPDINMFPIVIRDRIFYFTTLCFMHHASGDIVYLVKDMEHNFMLLNTGYEPDCDGAYNWVSVIDAINLDAYDVIKDFRINKEELWDMSIFFYNAVLYF